MPLDASFQSALDQLKTTLKDLADEALTIDTRDNTDEHAQALVTLTVDQLADMIGGFPTPVRVATAFGRPRPRHQRPAGIPKFFPPVAKDEESGR